MGFVSLLNVLSPSSLMQVVSAVVELQRTPNKPHEPLVLEPDYHHAENTKEKGSSIHDQLAVVVKYISPSTLTSNTSNSQ